ncbi:hypothetical protein AAF712_015765 [Marasmius tenuissimus]|uniref:Uncharacterized protein n=1 Tax=Marasmius tenuissimus TaxID=585030 RepID=A0ABR2Z7E2_9AGAR
MRIFLPSQSDALLDGHLERLNQLVQLFIERSRNVPLNLTFDSGSTLPDCHLIDLVLETLTKHANRWSGVEFVNPTPFVSHPAFRNVKQNLSSLRTLDAHHNLNPVLDLLGHPPLLGNLSFFHGGGLGQGANASWEHLSSLSIMAFGDVASLLDLLRLCAGVRHLKIVIAGSEQLDRARSLDHIPPVPRTINTIESLSFSCSYQDLDDTASLAFLRSIILPRLSSLELRGISCLFDSPENRTKNHFCDLIAQSECDITSLSLAHFDRTSDDQVIQLLQSMPKLKELHVEEQEMGPFFQYRTPPSNHIVTSRFLTRLAQRGNGGHNFHKTLVPLLTDLTLVVQAGDFDVEAFGSILLRRPPLFTDEENAEAKMPARNESASDSNRARE